MRKFDYCLFTCDNGTILAFDASKYGLAAARKVAHVELEERDLDCRIMHVYYGFGTDDYGEFGLSYWLRFEPMGNTFPVWAFFKRGILDD